MTIETLEVIIERTTLDLLLWRRFRREFPGLVEDTLRRNPGLARLGAMLPVGLSLQVDVPNTEPQGRSAARVVTLYD
jgi:phage tail protein X